MTYRILSALVGAAVLLACPAFAADNYNVKDASGTTISKASKDISSAHHDKVVLTDFAGADVLGLLTASPAANTLGARLKAIVDALTALSIVNISGTITLPTGASTAALQTTLNGYVDGIEGQLTTIDGRVDGLETAVASTNTKLDELIAAAEDTTAVAVTTAAASGTVRIASAAASTNLTEVSDSACTIMSITGSVARASPVYLKIYNIADGSVTVGTSTIAMTIPLPAGGDQPTVFHIPVNRTFATACSFAMTTAVADNSTAALTAADVLALSVSFR